jgi:ribosomal protein L20A (L18A)
MNRQLSNQRLLVVGLARDVKKTVQTDVMKLSASLKHCRALSYLWELLAVRSRIERRELHIAETYILMS